MRILSAVLCLCMLLSVTAMAAPATPTGSAAPTGSTQVVTPSTPTGEATPTNPSAPTGGTTPTDPSAPTGGTTPTDPSAPTGGTTPTDPSAPTGGTTPTDPSAPTGGTAPTNPTNPSAPVIPTAPTGSLPFTDVADDSGWYDAIAYCYKKGLMIGVTSTTFEPDTKLTRAMMVQILYRMDGCQKVDTPCTFTDVNQNKWYADAVNWAAATKVTLGTTATTFEADRVITREMMMTMFYRYFQMKGYTLNDKDVLAKFADASAVGDWAVEGVSWCVEVGLIVGVNDTTIDPKGTATRGQAATILARSDIFQSLK